MSLDPFVTVPTEGPTPREMAESLRAVSPDAATPLALSADVWAEVEPLYRRLARECVTAKRSAWKRWRLAIEPICVRLEVGE